MGLSKNKVFIIAEAGVNHNGSLECAKQMVDVAVEAKADAIKFQTFSAERLACKKAPKADYQLKSTESGESQLEMLKKLELSDEEFVKLQEYCNRRGIMFLSTPFDVMSLKFLISIGMKMIKISSGEITDYPLLREAGKSRLPIILSTGMCSMVEVKEAISVLRCYGATDITVLQCNTEYPTPYEDANLEGMLTLGKETNCNYGYSDHTEGNEIAIAAASLGAMIIEKHFTLDKNMEGPDHKASIEPKELCNLIRSIRNVERAMGDGEKKISNSERKNIDIARKSIVAACRIKSGEQFTENNITTKRPGSGLSPMKWDEVIGAIATRDYIEDEAIEL